MAMTPQDTIIGPARGTPGAVRDFKMRLWGSYQPEVGDYVTEIYRLAPLVGMDPAILVAQSAHETDNWTSPPWRDWLNPAGLGITRKGQDPGYRWPDGKAAAQAQIAHMAAYLWARDKMPDPVWARIQPIVWRDPRFSAVEEAGYRGTVRTIADLTGKWATDKQYHTKVAAKGNLIFPGMPDQHQQEEPVALPIPRFEQRIAPRGIPNRTNLPMASPSKITIHEVGNRSAGADAEMHVRFVHNGGGEHGVSFHFIVGYDKVCQLIELDEACWHASDGYNGPGNRDSIAIETVQIGDFDRTLWHLAWLCAEIVTNPARFVWKGGVPRPFDIDENDYQQHFNTAPDRKNCPQIIREGGLWPVLMGRIDQYIALFRNDNPEIPRPPPKPKYAKRSVPEWLTEEAINSGSNRRLGKAEVFYLGRKWEALRDTPRYRSAIRTSPEIGPKIRKGEHFLAHFILHSHGEWWVLSDLGTRVAMADLDAPSWLDLEELQR